MKENSYLIFAGDGNQMTCRKSFYCHDSSCKLVLEEPNAWLPLIATRLDLLA